jgi:hypothetical protein
MWAEREKIKYELKIMGKFLYHNKLKLSSILNLQSMECQGLLKAITIYSTALAMLKNVCITFSLMPYIQCSEI